MLKRKADLDPEGMPEPRRAHDWMLASGDEFILPSVLPVEPAQPELPHKPNDQSIGFGSILLHRDYHSCPGDLPVDPLRIPSGLDDPVQPSLMVLHSWTSAQVMEEIKQMPCRPSVRRPEPSPAASVAPANEPPTLQLHTVAPGSTVGDFLIGVQIGKGSFGKVFQAIDQRNAQTVALKVSLKPLSRRHFENEFKVMTDLAGTPGFLRPLEFHRSSNGLCAIAMELGGSPLSSYMRTYKKLSTKTVSMLALQALSLIEALHDKGYVHRDLKPENFLMGAGSNMHRLYLIDTGMAFQYMKDGAPVPQNVTGCFFGTPRYASLPQHKRERCGRRDDIESLAYVLIFMCRGFLPWSFEHRNMCEAIKFTGIAKEKKTITHICSRLPPYLKTMLTHARELSYDQRPNYEQLRQEITKFMNSKKMANDYVFEWSAPHKARRTKPAASSAP